MKTIHCRLQASHSIPPLLRKLVVAAGMTGAALALISSTAQAAAFAGSAGSAAASTLAPVSKAALEQKVAEMATKMLVPGVVVVLRTPSGEIDICWGNSGFQGQVGTSLQQHVRVGSNTKTWTGTVILQQVQEGLLKLDDKVSKYRPDVPNGDNITIEQLLNMRSGLFNYSTTLELNETLDREPLKAWTQQELLAMAYKHDADLPKRTGFYYSNTNTVLLGLIAQQLDGGKPLWEIMQRRLFAPLGLKESSFPLITENSIPVPLARGYMYGTNVLSMGTPPALPPDMQAEARAGKISPVEQTLANPSWGWAAGAGISTASDLATWVEALVQGRLLNPDMQRKRLASVQPINPDNPASPQYGLAIAKFGPLYGHTGELPGYNSFMGHDPDQHVTLVVWTNLAPTVDGHDPATEIAKELLGLIYPAKK